MAQRARSNGTRTFPRSRTFGTAAITARQQLAFLWSRESLLRLLLSFVLALALWLYVTSKQNPQLAQDYPQPLRISAANIPNGLATANDNLGVVYVTIRLSGSNTPVTTASFYPYVDLQGLGPGLHRVKVQVISDPGIRVVATRPSALTVLLERVQSRRVVVQPHLLGHPPAGYGTQVQVQPQEVTVSGPEELVAQVARAGFDVDLTGLTSTVSATDQLSPENTQGGKVTGHITLQPSQVHVTVAIQPSSSYKTLPVLVQLTGQPKTGVGVFSVAVQPPEITASGSQAALSHISTVKTSPVSVSKQRSGTLIAHPTLRLRGGLHSRTRTVTVQVRLAPVQASSSIEIGLVPYGVDPSLVAHTDPGRVLVTVVGPSNLLSGAARQMHAIINLSGYSAGTYTLTPSVTAPKGLQVGGVYPASVTVTLTPSTG